MARMDTTSASVSVWKASSPVASITEGRDSPSPSVDSQTEEKVEPSPRRRAPRKKVHTVGIWPCKINGCSKEFAREADLKRHQRTTKLHSMPS